VVTLFDPSDRGSRTSIQLPGRFTASPIKRPKLPRIVVLLASLWVILLGFGPVAALTFDRRVEAADRIEHLRYSYLTGTTRPYSEVVTRQALQEMVRSDLSLSIALERFWGVSISSEALRRELERIATDTLYPDRLREIYVALEDDPVLILETFARSSLVRRLARGFFSKDERIHGAARGEAERILALLTSGALAVEATHPRRSIIEFRRHDRLDDAIPSYLHERFSSDRHGVTHVNLAPDEYAEERPRAFQVTSISPVLEQNDSFVVTATLPAEPESVRIAVYTIPKISWDAWWNGQSRRFPAASARTVVTTRRGLTLPTPRTVSPPHHLPTPAPAHSGSISCPPNDTWDTQRFEGHPHAMAGHAAVWTGNEMIVWGGRQQGGYLYDPLINTWRPISTDGAPEVGRLVWTGSEIVVFNRSGGGRFDPVVDRWAPISASDAPELRGSLAAEWTGKEIIVYDAGFGIGALYDPTMDSWRPMNTQDAPSPLGLLAAVWTGSEMIVWGGFNSPTPPLGGRYDPVADTWTPISSTGAPNVRRHPVVAWTGEEMFVWGGDCTPPQAGKYNPATDAWSEISLTGAADTCMSSHASAWTGHEVVVWNAEHRRGATYDPSADRWTSMTSVNAPSGREHHSTAWTGDVMIVWGGTGATGGRYDPQTDSWTPTSTPAGPEARRRHRALWTGNEMLIWDGSKFRVPWFGDGARYDPVTAQWTAIPPSILDAKVTWTGTEMLAWNGYSGGRFNPILETWKSMTVIDDPIGRREFSVVWTGDELILWGGTEPDPGPDDDDHGGFPVNVGASYDPLEDRWTRVSVDDAPSPRRRHIAVWTGREMLMDGRLDPVLGRLRRGDGVAVRSRNGQMDPSFLHQRPRGASPPQCRLDRPGDDRLGRAHLCARTDRDGRWRHLLLFTRPRSRRNQPLRGRLRRQKRRHRSRAY